MTDILGAKIIHTAQMGWTSFGHDGEVYTDLRPFTTSRGVDGYRFDHGEKNDPHLKVYFISDDGAYLTVWERGYGTETMSFSTSSDDDPGRTLNDRFTSLNAQLDEGVFYARLESAVEAYEESGQPQEFEWRGNTYSNLHDPGNPNVDYRFHHGQGDQLKVFFFAEDGSYVSGWSRAGQTTHAHPDRTETDDLYNRLLEVDGMLPASFTVPLTLEEHLEKVAEESDGEYEFQIAGRDMLVMALSDNTYLLFTDHDFVNGGYLYPVHLSDNGTSVAIRVGDAYSGIDLTHQWTWSPTNDDELGDLLYGNGLSDTLYGRVQAIEWDMNETIELYFTEELSGFLTFVATIDQVPGRDEIRIQVEGEARSLFSYNDVTTIEGTINHDRDGSEIQSIQFASEGYDLLGFGEYSTLTGTINEASSNLTIEAYDAFGYNETIVIALAVNERANGYRVGLDIDIDSSLVSAECSASANLSEDLTVSSLDVNCSDDELESDIEDIFDEVAVGLIDSVLDEGLQESVNVIPEFGFVDETAPEYTGAFAPVDGDVWVG